MLLVITTLGIIDTIWSHASPNYRPAIISELLPDWWTWQIWVIVILLVALIATLETAYRRIRELTPNVEIRLIFDETRPVYKEIVGFEETYAIGVSAIGGKVENPEVFAQRLFQLTSPRKGIRTPTARLSPATNSQTLVTINPGRTPTYFVNILKHKMRHPEIEFCCSPPSSPIRLERGEYELELMARGSNNIVIGVMDLMLWLDERNNLKITKKNEQKG